MNLRNIIKSTFGKTILLFIVLGPTSIINIKLVFAQAGTWTWMHGSQAISYTGNYGTKGVSSPTNAPPARYRSAFWKDQDGIFWLFGGTDFNNSIGYNDLWKFDPKINQWTWMHGPQYGSNIVGSPGIKGVSSPSNFPSAYGIPSSWVGEDGHLYLFGPSSAGDDMWRYNISTNEWTWLTGETTPFGLVKANHGTKGVASPTNTPGKRELAARNGWVYDNKLWLFGGQKYVANTILPGNDLWSFDLTTNLWTWVSGPDAPPYIGTYGVQNTPSVTNNPPGRWALTNWIGNDKFYLFGGWRRSDFWEFDPATNEWTWKGGSQISNDPGLVTQNCKYDKQFIPHGYRLEGLFAQKNYCAANHWLFGGRGSFGGQDIYNELWVFNSDSTSWNLVWGNNGIAIPGAYGSLGQAALTNAPPGRDAGAMWIDDENNVWVFGGSTTNSDVLGDMWKFTPDTSCVKITNDTDSLWTKEFSICDKDSVLIQFSPNTNISVTPASNTHYERNTGNLYLFPTPPAVYEINVSPPFCGKREKGTVTIKSSSEPISLFELQPKQTTLSNPRFSTNNLSTGADHYQWYVDGGFISSQKNINKTFNERGEYCFTLVAENNCGKDTSTLCGTIESDIFIPNAFSPNGDGNNDIIKIISAGSFDLHAFSIFNRWGQMVFYTNDPQNGWNGKLKGVDCEIGVYFYMINYSLAGTERQLRGDITLVR